MSQKSCKRPWRKLVKKNQRKRRRQNLARQKEKELEDAELEKLKDPLYKSWLEQQEIVERQQQMLEENKRQEQEHLWLSREELAQKHFQSNELKRQAEEAKLQAERLKQEESLRLLEEARQKKREEIRLQTEKAAKDFNDIMKCMQEYLEDYTMKTPTRLEYIVQTRPGEKSCDFFNKTNCCRYDPNCSFNHKRPILANVIIIRHFFLHPLLEQHEHEEYSRSDSALELNEHDLRESYDEFCEDVWPVLEEFGEIMNFRTVRNIQTHLRGNVFVEYVEKRSALKAFINLQNRYYASKRLNVQFSNIRLWHKAVCGMSSDFLQGLSLGRKCPKGVKCNFLHLMKNMDNKYDIHIHNPERSLRNISKCAKQVSESSAISWDSDELFKNKSLKSRNWRWSESPEIELKTKTNTEKSSFSKSAKRKSPDGRLKSNSPQLKTHSPNLHSKTYSQNSRSQSPNLRYDKNKEKYPAEEKLEERKKSSHKSRSPKLHQHQRAKKSKNKSPLIDRKHSSNKKTKR